MRAHQTFLGFAIVIGCCINLQSTASSQEYRGERGATNGLHARRLAALRFASPYAARSHSAHAVAARDCPRGAGARKRAAYAR